MNQGINIQLFERSKHNISDSANKLKNYIIFQLVLGIILAIILGVTLFVALGFTTAELENLNQNNMYQFGQDLINRGLFSTAVVAAVFLILVGVAFIIVSILLFVQYIRLGSSFNKLYESERMVGASKNISYGFYGYVVAVIIGFFAPGIGGSIVSIAGNTSLAIAAYFIYQLFIEYRDLGRFRGKPSNLLFIGLALQIISSIVSFFTLYGGLVGLIGFIMMLMGFRDLSRDMKLVASPGRQVAQKQAPQAAVYTPTQPAKAPAQATADTKIKYCENCGAKLIANAKFCSSCGANV